VQEAEEDAAWALREEEECPTSSHTISKPLNLAIRRKQRRTPRGRCGRKKSGRRQRVARRRREGREMNVRVPFCRLVTALSLTLLSLDS